MDKTCCIARTEAGLVWIYDYQSEQDNPYRQQPFVRITTIAFADNLPAWTYPWHKHRDDYELAFIASGSGRLDIGAQSFSLQAGSAGVIQPGVSHRFNSESPQGMDYYTLRFDARPEDGELQAFFKGIGTAVTSAANYMPHIESTMRVLFSGHHANGGVMSGAFQAIALGLVELTRMLFANQAMTLRFDSKYSMSDILDYLSENIDQKITLKLLARRFNISESHLNRLFQQAYHVSPIDYLIQSRIVMSTEYLTKTDFTVNEIAERVGYSNPAHFTNMFIKRIGCTPSEYREQMRKGK